MRSHPSDACHDPNDHSTLGRPRTRGRCDQSIAHRARSHAIVGLLAIGIMVVAIALGGVSSVAAGDAAAQHSGVVVHAPVPTTAGDMADRSDDRVSVGRVDPSIDASTVTITSRTTPRNATSGSQRNSDAATSGRIRELYPNPTTAGNEGEYLIVTLPEAGNWSITDGYHDAIIPANATGTVALSMQPNQTAAHVSDDVPIHRLSDHFRLSATGDRIVLRKDGEVVDVVEYDRVREGHRWRAEWDEWRPDGLTPRSPRSVPAASVTPFVLPDSPDAPIDPLRAADEAVLVAAYTLESDRLVDLLVAAADRGVRVRVLVEGTPVGGFSKRGASAAERLTAAGVEVRVLEGDVTRFRFHHAKYAVADDRAVVLTENWKASGTGGRSSRGWGVSVADDRFADELKTLFTNDVTAADTQSWAAFKANTTFHPTGTADGSYPTRFRQPDPTAADVELLTAPGNAEDRVVDRIDAADDRVLAIVPRVDGPDGRLVRALRRAAARGVETRLLLSGSWYDRDDNRELARALGDDPVSVHIAEPRGRFEKVHAKGLVIDDTAIVGSLNWNDVSATENREVLVAIEDEPTADFYAQAYGADWRGGGRQLPIGLAGGLLGAILVAGIVGHHQIQFLDTSSHFR